ncbi:hypothetical protein AWE51_22055 [Aquimarina aggregata]|uniref:Uncharacterized protein n=1 Tax=Aquimarina aggregata TaxID=1642818 RepID=A0A163BH06_9FLAO|nr:hypothetical protein [Aquimarina aggregata]KZS41390.1 hypothetical protein AWE51_22055 [Aquimarina aggregata]
MKTEQEIITLLSRIETITDRIKKLDDPPFNFKLESCEFRILLAQKDMFHAILEHKGYNLIDAYDHLDSFLNELENK